MRETRVSSRYALSLLELALEQNQLEKARQDVKYILTMLNESRDLRIMLESPVIAPEKKVAVFRALFKDAASPITIKFLELLVKSKREKYLQPIFQEFVSQYNEHKGVQKAIVTTAVGLDDNLRKKVNELIRTQTKSEVELVEVIDKSLIGGFTLKFGDKQIDSSIARSLKKMRRSLGENPYKSKL